MWNVLFLIIRGQDMRFQVLVFSLSFEGFEMIVKEGEGREGMRGGRGQSD